MIRKSEPKDHQVVASLMIQAMEDWATAFTKSEDLTIAHSLFEKFFQQKGNQYSFENAWVALEGNEVIASITAYDGGKLRKFRQPFLDYVNQKFGYDVALEDETESGEFYIDTIGVLPSFQGKGIGRKLIEFIVSVAEEMEFDQVGLLVDVENPAAKRLYEKIGFQVVGRKELMDGQYEHLVLKV